MTQLPATRTWPFTHGGRDLDVTIGYIGWPELIVLIAERGRDHVLEARFREDGRLSALTFRSGRGEITTADLRRPAILGALRAWEAHGRAAGRCILADYPEPDPAHVASGPGGALRQLAHGAPAKPRSRKRGTELRQLLADVAAAYRAAVDAGDPAPCRAVGERLGYSRGHAARLVMQARKTAPPLLGPALRGLAGEMKDAA